MLLFKTFSLHIALMTCTTFHIMASEEVIIERNTNLPLFSKKVSPHQSPTKIKQPLVKPHINYRTLKINHPLEKHELGQLMDRDCREIHLLGVYIAYEKEGAFLKAAPFIISPETINPDVEVLSLKSCGINDSDIKGIGEFKKLKKLIFSSNHLTDSCIHSISQLRGLESLSLISEGISNASIPSVLSMPGLTELDISLNKQINDEVAKSLFENTTLKKINISFTGLTRQEQKRIENKYKNHK